MLKRLNLLKPDKRQIFLEGGKGQAVNYLNIPRDMNISDLENDVKNGAVHFKELLETANKRPSRVVVVECENEELGLMAVTYLAAIYNEADKVCYNLDDPEDIYETKEVPLGIEDYTNYNARDLMNNIQYSEGNCDEECGDEWEENPFALPIITSKELKSYGNNPFNETPFGEADSCICGIESNSNKKPYWLSLQSQPICIVDDNRYKGYSFEGMYGNISLNSKLKRYSNNRHIYILSIHEEYDDKADSDIEGPVFFVPHANYKQDLYTLILEQTAALVEVKSSEKELLKYHNLLFENWAFDLGVNLIKGFPKAKILEQILKINKENKSELIEKVYRYVLSQDGVGNVLTLNDFEIIKKFKAIGVDEEDKNNKSSIKKLEKELIGLEEVKEQIYGLIDVMKYHKRRAAMGCGTSGYHNVHLMIGAPGTAKTTMAKILGNIMMEQKLLPGNRFVSINGADLKAKYVGHSAPKTKAYFDSNDIIFIDEAYSLTTEKGLDPFSQEALAQLVIELEKHGLDKLVIFAGYGGKDIDDKDNKMLQFIESNLGIRSRINSTIYFKSYSPEDMVAIVHCIASNGKFILTNEGDELIKTYFAKRVKKSDFGNGREARSLVENIALEAARRVMRLDEKKQTKRALSELTLSDVEAAINRMDKSYDMQNGRNCGAGISYGFSI